MLHFNVFLNNLMLLYRARLVNYLKASEVVRQPYPLQVRSTGHHSYFMKRETWGWTDFLMNPMVKKIDHVELNLQKITWMSNSLNSLFNLAWNCWKEQILMCKAHFFVFVAPLGYDDGVAPADHCPAAQGGQHQ